MAQRSSNSPADPFASVFQALRTSLTSQIVHAQPHSISETSRTTVAAAAPIPLNIWPHASSSSSHSSSFSSAAANSFMGLVAQHDPNVCAALRQQVQLEGSAHRQELRRRRKQAQRRRQTLQQQQQAIASECDHVTQQAQVNATKYTQFAHQSHARARQRLQTLLFECVAEMQKALERVDGVAIEATDESESMDQERATQFAWDVFLARLQHDLNEAIGFSQLYPTRVSTGGGALTNSSRTRSTSSSDAGTDLKSLVRDLLIQNGPMLEPGETLQIQRIITVVPSRSATSPHSAASTLLDVSSNSKPRPSLHFGDSGSSAWLEIARATIRATTPPSASLSRRSHRQLPPSKGVVSTTFSTTSSTSGETSEIRQFTTKTTPQFPRTECDVPLSSTCISWLLTGDHQHPTKPAGGSNWAQTIDSNVYFDLEEYERKLTNAVGLGNALASPANTTFVTDKAVFASAQRSLHEVNQILEQHARKFRSSSSPQQHQILRARRAGSPESDPLSHQHHQQRRESVFVRASVLQLVQTTYYSEKFLHEVSPSDVVVLEQLYPTSLFGASILENLYVPCFDVDVDANPSAEPEVVVPTSPTRAIVMKTLDEKAIHELLLVYVARGRQGNTEASSNGGARLTSLAISDSISALYPEKLGPNTSDKAEPASARPPSSNWCAIKNPGSLWKQGRTVKRSGAAAPESSDAQVVSSAEYLYVEYAVLQARFTQELLQRKASPATDLSTQNQEVFSRGCYWRSCLSPAQQSITTSKQSLCAWHGVLKQFLSADDVEQYLLSPCELKSCLATLDSGSKAESVKRVIQKSSPLLDELTSSQLATSIGSFFEHVKLSFSNRAFEQNHSLDGHESIKTGANDMDVVAEEPLNQRTVDDLEALAEKLEQILTLERSCSKEFQRLNQLTVYLGVDTSVVRKACLEIKKYDAGVRTTDLELTLRLSTRKLQLVRRRREDEEARVTQRLTQDNISISGYSAASFTSYASDTTITAQDGSWSSSSPMYDVVHVLRKGRKSLMQQQRLNQGFRPQSAGSNSATKAIDKGSLSRSVSGILHQAPQFELQHSVVKRGSGVATGKKTSARPFRK